MPNWCNNRITITGPKDKLKDLLEKLKVALQSNNGSLLSVLSPQPDNIFKDHLGSAERAMCAAEGIPNWYDWNSENWGTKWDVDVTLSFEETDDGAAQIEGYFDSAWSPPLAAYEQFLKNNSDCSIYADYCEPCMDFMGTWKDGHDNCLSVYEVMSQDPKKWSATEKQLINDYGLIDFCELEEFEWFDNYSEDQLERELEAA